MSLQVLDEASLERQRAAGETMRALHREVVAQMLSCCRRPGLMLSGGMDSAAVLHEMLAAGAKPLVLTFCAPGSQPGSDARRALALAAHHGLDARVVTLTQDVEAVASFSAQVVERFETLSTRADVEVMHLVREMLVEAAKAGCDAVFTGISDRSMHLVSRMWETSARSGRTTAAECDAARVIALVDDQYDPMVALAADVGLALCAPLALVAAMLPYRGLSWMELNSPRNKEVVRRAYAGELAGDRAAGVSMTISPMQCADSGARSYFDRAASESLLADELAGRVVTSAKTYYNSLLAAHGRGGADLSQDKWPSFRRNTCGMEPEAGYTDPVPVDARGREAVDDDDLLADPAGDRRLDCWGNPLRSGDQASMNGCVRALAGLCGTWRPGVAYDFTACEGFEVWYAEGAEAMRASGEAMVASGVGAAALVGELHVARSQQMRAMARDIAGGEQVRAVHRAAHQESAGAVPAAKSTGGG